MVGFCHGGNLPAGHDDGNDDDDDDDSVGDDDDHKKGGLPLPTLRSTVLAQVTKLGVKRHS